MKFLHHKNRLNNFPIRGYYVKVSCRGIENLWSGHSSANMKPVAETVVTEYS